MVGERRDRERDLEGIGEQVSEFETGQEQQHGSSRSGAGRCAPMLGGQAVQRCETRCGECFFGVWFFISFFLDLLTVFGRQEKGKSLFLSMFQITCV